MGMLFAHVVRRLILGSTFRDLFMRIQQKFLWIQWLSLFVLVATGMFQMSAHPAYQGLLIIENRWTFAIFLKHAVIAVLFVLSLYETLWVSPALRRIYIRQDHELPVDIAQLKRLEKQHNILIWFSLGIALGVLGLTAIARVS